MRHGPIAASNTAWVPHSEGELVQVALQVFAFDAVVVGAGIPSFEQRRDAMRPRKGDVARFRRAVPGCVLVGESLVGQYAEHPGAVRPDQRAGFDGGAGEVDNLFGARSVRDPKAHPSQHKPSIHLCSKSFHGYHDGNFVR